MAEDSLLPAERIEKAILLIRGHKVMLDSDFAELYGYPPKCSPGRCSKCQCFPADFMFRLTTEEEALRSQIVTSKAGRGGRRSLPYAFTEQGVGRVFLRPKEEVELEVTNCDFQFGYAGG